MIASLMTVLIRAAVMLAMAMSLSVVLPSNATAQVVLTFVAKRGSNPLDFPHSILRIGGTTESGEAIDRNFGYMPNEQSVSMMLGGRVSGAVLDKPEASVPWDLITPYISVQIPDAMLDAVIDRFRYWTNNENGGYDFFSQNCIAFLADVAGTIGLNVPPGNHLSPGGFLSELAGLNPPGSHPGILPEPIANPVIQEQPDLPSPAVPGGAAAEAPKSPPAPVPARVEPALT